MTMTLCNSEKVVGMQRKWCKEYG